MQNQIKTKDRVADFGEVFTNDREIDNMLNLVSREVSRIESKILEPAAGNGNFLVKILEKKLYQVRKKYKRNQSKYELYSFVAISSLYGIDILEDNIKECREKLCRLFCKEYEELFGQPVCNKLYEAVRYLLEKNIIWGNSLTGITGGVKSKPIYICQWEFNEDKVTRKDFLFNDMKVYEQFSSQECNYVKSRKDYEKVPFKEVLSYE